MANEFATLIELVKSAIKDIGALKNKADEIERTVSLLTIDVRELRNGHVGRCVKCQSLSHVDGIYKDVSEDDFLGRGEQNVLHKNAEAKIPRTPISVEGNYMWEGKNIVQDKENNVEPKVEVQHPIPNSRVVDREQNMEKEENNIFWENGTPNFGHSISKLKTKYMINEEAKGANLTKNEKPSSENMVSKKRRKIDFVATNEVAIPKKVEEKVKADGNSSARSYDVPIFSGQKSVGISVSFNFFWGSSILSELLKLCRKYINVTSI